MATRKNNNNKKNSTPSSSEKEQKRMIFINYFPAKLCRSRTSKENNPFFSVSFKFKDNWASFALSPNMIKQSTNRDGELIAGRNNLFLGEARQRRKVSICDGNGNYTYEDMSNGDLSHFIKEFQAA